MIKIQKKREMIDKKKSIPNHITVFEYQKLKVGILYDEVTFEEKHRIQLERFYGDKGVPYYNLINKGVSFNHYVGVIRVGQLTIEVLPKADKNENKNSWQKILIGMLRAVGAFNVTAPSSSSLSIKSNFILDLYFELFIKEVEYLLHKGLIKKYRKIEGNSNALKGSLQFSKHLQQNIVHQERFYIKHSTYDKEHLLHQILFETLELLVKINSNVALNSRINSLLISFPEMKKINATEALFDKIIYNRKTKEYKNAIEISRLLLLNYHPDLSSGRNNVLALMFDMNILWEKFVYVSLRKHLTGKRVIAQTIKDFLKPEKGRNSLLRPDIVIDMNTENTIVLDTKWKNLDNNPTSDDLRQMYFYHKYFKAKKVALVYPGKFSINTGRYFDPDGKLSDDKCSVIHISTTEPDENINDWQKAIKKQISDWIGL